MSNHSALQRSPARKPAARPKDELTVVFHDLLNRPIVGLKYEIRSGDKVLASGSTNDAGEALPITGPAGTMLDVYVGKLMGDGLKHVLSTPILAGHDAIVLRSPKFMLELGLHPHTGVEGKYQPRSYVVQPGDTVSDIARAKGLTTEEMLRANGLDRHAKIKRGQVLKVPAKVADASAHAPASASARAPAPTSAPAALPASTSKGVIASMQERGKAIFEHINSPHIERDKDGRPHIVFGSLCKDQTSCLKKGAPDSDLNLEINVRLAGFGGCLPSRSFMDMTEQCVKQFQRDYMKAPETGRVCGGTLKALDEFMEKYPLPTALFDQLRCPCRQYGGQTACVGWGVNERNGIHRSLLWALRAMMFYLQDTKPAFSFNSVSSGYRCDENNRGHNSTHAHRTTVNHKGLALDVQFSRNGALTHHTSDMNAIRSDIFEKFMGASTGHRLRNKIFLESAGQGAVSWVHFDVRSFESAYLDPTDMYCRNIEAANGESLLKKAKQDGDPALALCAGNGGVLPLQSNGNGDQRVNPQQLFLSEKGKAFVKDYEKLRLDYYNDCYGYCTVGWGHLVDGKVSCEVLGKSGTIEMAEAQRLFDVDVKVHEQFVVSAITAPLFQHEFDALCSLAFNIGSIALKAPNLCKKINAKQYTDAAAEFLDITNGGESGLVKRRKQENAMFLEKNYDSTH